MEKGKLDYSSLIGMGLLGALLFWFMQSNNAKKEENPKPKTEKIENQQVVPNKNVVVNPNDSIALQQNNTLYGAFGFSTTQANAATQDIVVKTKLQTITFSSKGGFIKELVINDQKRKFKNSNENVKLIANNNAALNLTFATADNRTIQTKDMYFQPSVTKSGDDHIVSMKLKTADNAYVEFLYKIQDNDYMIDWTVHTINLGSTLNSAIEPKLDFMLKAYSNEKSITYENRYTEAVYEYDGGKDDYLNPSKTDTETPEDVTYIAFKQHLFSTILLTNTAFKNAKISQENLVENEDPNAQYLKTFQAQMPLAYKNGQLDYKMNLYFGPSDYNILKKYDRNLDEILNLGWGIFGWINKFLFIPIFNFLTTILPYGLAIIFLTIVIRLIMSPVQYKSYVSQAKMKVIKPEVAEIAEKYKNDPMKKQQETMKLYNKAGVSPMAGCLPMFIQIPVFYALFQFFPSAFDLRQKSFLWAEDLSSYDSVAQLPFTIPFYGNHVSLFPILAALATFVYMKMTTGDQSAMTPTQEGMPDMSKIMKIMIYISPIMMLFFFNNYASGLSLYYFISNVITIGIMYVIKNKIVSEEKVKAKIDANKLKDRPKSKFQRKMEEMMEQAQQQQKNRK